ncbi:MAG: aminopeptidase [Acidobacteriales bacterium]|nr:aminopeptidase [Terriglobales bacterium]
MSLVQPEVVEPEVQLSFAQRLDKLAEVAVRVGLNLRQGQELLITAPLEAVPLVRRITEHAYRAGALLVSTLYSDDETALARFRFAPDESFDRAATWLHDGIAEAYRSGTARLGITGADPSLLSQQDPAKVGRANVAASKASRAALEFITRHSINWSIIACATPAWARAVFPGEPEQTAVTKLWDAIFRTSRIDAEDPVAEWQRHGVALHRRRELMNEKRYAGLHFVAPGTDLHVGLADGHLWQGGGSRAQNGIECQPNIPTEEVFTTPHKDGVNGTVTSTKPLSYQGSLIEGIRVKFENGRITEAHATKGERVLEQMISTDEGARKLGEVALVPHSSPIASSGLLFWNTLFDENAASHIALGQAYSTCMIDGDTAGEKGLFARGANESLIHVDWMIGSGEMDVYGVKQDGSEEPLMRRGDWV